MKPYLLAGLATAVVMLGLDAVWLGVISMPIYRAAIGHLMAASVNGAAALAFYALYVAGLMYFVVTPRRGDGRDRPAVVAVSGALFGLCAYGTYDLTNLATLRGWPLHLVLIDMAWGMTISALSASAGWAVFRRAGAAAGRLTAGSA